MDCACQTVCSMGAGGNFKRGRALEPHVGLLRTGTGCRGIGRVVLEWRDGLHLISFLV
jgi:hypothetical protein